MRGSQRPGTPGKRSLVVRVDQLMYEQALEWSLQQDLPIRAIVDAILWQWFTGGHHHPHLRTLVLQQARAIAESIRDRGSSSAQHKLPRWSRRGQPTSSPIAMPPPISRGAAPAASG